MPSSCCSSGLLWRSRSLVSPMPFSGFVSAICKEGHRPFPRPEPALSTNQEFPSHQRRTNMEVILLERVAKLGQMGEVVRVKDGFARNFLLPQGKALRATKDNRTKFDAMKSQLEARNLELKGDAEKVSTKLDRQSFVVIRQASETGQLYGSVSPRDLVAILEN